MISSKTLRSHQIRTLLRHLNPKSQTEIHPIPSVHTKPFLPNSIFNRNISLSSQFQHQSPTQNPNPTPLESLFAEAVGVSQTDIEDHENRNHDLKKSLRKLEVELRRNRSYSKALSGIVSKPLESVFVEAVGLSEIRDQNAEELEIGLKSLSDLFTSNDRRGRSKKECRNVEELIDFKELSPDMAMFANYLHRKGYLMNANFLPNNKFDVSCFENNYGRDFLKFAAEKFAEDHREIGKWLPAGDLKKVAQFGCPSLGRKNVFSAKSMRLFLGIQEETVCNKCTLKASCKFANQSVWKKGAKHMDLTVIMRVVTLYALEAVPRDFEVTDEIKTVVSRLLNEVVRLSEIEC